MGFVELQDFTNKMILIAPNDKSKISKYRQEIEKTAFLSIKSRVQFYNYDFAEKLHDSQLVANQYSNFLNDKNYICRIQVENASMKHCAFPCFKTINLIKKCFHLPSVF